MAPILVTFAVGLTSGYSAVLLPQLKNGTDGIPSDEITASWIGKFKNVFLVFTLVKKYIT